MARLNFDDLNITSQDDDILNEDEALAGLCHYSVVLYCHCKTPPPSHTPPPFQDTSKRILKMSWCRRLYGKDWTYDSIHERLSQNYAKWSYDQYRIVSLPPI